MENMIIIHDNKKSLKDFSKKKINVIIKL